jgi:hypothetical protein
MPALDSLDLFSGVGGITLALHGFARPVAYCEKAQNAVDVLQHNMRARRLPSAPICRDIADMDAAWLQQVAGVGVGPGRPVDLIVAGFPCVGFSTAGVREGFRNAESALFAELLRVLDAVSSLQRRRAPAVFLENVANILHIGVRHVVAELCWRRGFDLRWCVMPASSVGAPQLRSRWFCLATPAGFRARWTGLRYTPYSWTSKSEPPRMTLTRDPLDAVSSGSGIAGRVAMLGNSVVPDAVRCAFMYLLSPDPDVDIRSSTAGFVALADGAAAAASRRRWRWGPTLPKCAQVNGRTLHELAPVRHRPRRFRITLDPRAFRQTRAAETPRDVGPLVTKPEKRALWGTLTKNDGTGNVLTERNKKKIMVQVRFEERTPDRVRAGRMTAEFAEWVMGFPIDWTRLTTPQRPA